MPPKRTTSLVRGHVLMTHTSESWYLFGSWRSFKRAQGHSQNGFVLWEATREWIQNLVEIIKVGLSQYTRGAVNASSKPFHPPPVNTPGPFKMRTCFAATSSQVPWLAGFQFVQACPEPFFVPAKGSGWSWKTHVNEPALPVESSGADKKLRNQAPPALDSGEISTSRAKNGDSVRDVHFSNRG